MANTTSGKTQTHSCKVGTLAIEMRSGGDWLPTDASFSDAWATQECDINEALADFRKARPSWQYRIVRTCQQFGGVTLHCPNAAKVTKGGRRAVTA